MTMSFQKIWLGIFLRVINSIHSISRKMPLVIALEIGGAYYAQHDDWSYPRALV